jgi:hypothetical protein
MKQTALWDTACGAGDRRPQRTVHGLEQDLTAALKLLPVVVRTAVEGGVLLMTRAIDVWPDLRVLLFRVTGDGQLNNSTSASELCSTGSRSTA